MFKVVFKPIKPSLTKCSIVASWPLCRYTLLDEESIHLSQQEQQNHLQDQQNHHQDHQHHPKGGPAVDVIYIASYKEETNPGDPGQVQDHQEHHRDDQEQLLDNFLEVFNRF